MRRYNIVYQKILGSYRVSEGKNPLSSGIALDDKGATNGDDLKILEFFKKQREFFEKRKAEVYLSNEVPCDEGLSLFNGLKSIRGLDVRLERFEIPAYNKHSDTAKGRRDR